MWTFKELTVYAVHSKMLTPPKKFKSVVSPGVAISTGKWLNLILLRNWCQNVETKKYFHKSKSWLNKTKKQIG